MNAAYFSLLPGSDKAAYLSWAADGAPWLKVCNASLIAPAKALGASVFWRPCYLQGDFGEGDCADGEAWGKIVTAAILSTGGTWPAVIGFRNELNPTTANAVEYARYRATLRQAGFRGLVAYGSFGNGRPAWSEYATIPSDADCLELHEYMDRTVADSPGLALRHVQAIAAGWLSPTMPLIIGELGNWTNGRGWQGTIPAEQMAVELRRYLSGCAPSVQQVFVFTDGDNGDPQWRSFTTRGTSVEAAIRNTWALPVPLPTPEPPAPQPHKEGHMTPGPIFHFDQGATKDCWVRCIQAFFLRYGYPVGVDTIFQAGKGHIRPPGGEAATFAEVKQAINTLAQQLGTSIQLADFDNPPTVMAALHDPNTANPWTVIAGVSENDLQPGQNYGHFMILYQIDDKGYVYVVDSYAAEDGNSSGKYPWDQMARAMIDSWEPSIDAIGCKILSQAA